MLGFIKKSAQHSEALAQVRAWTRERFTLGEEATVMVSEIACGLPGCPPLETVVVFWSEGDTRHSFKVFKPVTAVVEDDLPPWWMKNAIAVSEDFEPGCC